MPVSFFAGAAQIFFSSSFYGMLFCLELEHDGKKCLTAT
ncbi:hypothetical protein CHCC20335_1955 [Bacillus paralicheniformis]|nr:hypothetical protein CHCC20335_1955 [Bacillus paralicheniformis]